MAEGQAPTPNPVSYFVTVRTFGCKSVFHDETKAATLVDVMETQRRQDGFKKYGYVVMPDHYHVLLDGQPLWDDAPEVLVLYTSRSRLEKLNYIHHKPVLCGAADRAEDYAFSSARFYFERHGRCIFDP